MRGTKATIYKAREVISDNSNFVACQAVLQYSGFEIVEEVDPRFLAIVAHFNVNKIDQKNDFAILMDGDDVLCFDFCDVIDWIKKYAVFKSQLAA
jgi:hypothetical protein